MLPRPSCHRMTAHFDWAAILGIPCILPTGTLDNAGDNPTAPIVHPQMNSARRCWEALPGGSHPVQTEAPTHLAHFSSLMNSSPLEGDTLR